MQTFSTPGVNRTIGNSKGRRRGRWTSGRALTARRGPSRDELAGVGVRRLSIGSALARVAYGATYEAARDLLNSGTLSTTYTFLDRAVASRVFTKVG